MADDNYWNAHNGAGEQLLNLGIHFQYTFPRMKEKSAILIWC